MGKGDFLVPFRNLKLYFQLGSPLMARLNAPSFSVLVISFFHSFSYFAHSKCVMNELGIPSLVSPSFFERGGFCNIQQLVRERYDEQWLMYKYNDTYPFSEYNKKFLQGLVWWCQWACLFNLFPRRQWQFLHHQFLDLHIYFMATNNKRTRVNHLTKHIASQRRTIQ